MGQIDEGERQARMLMTWVAEPGDPDACQLVHEFSAIELVRRLRSRDHDQPKVRSWAQRLKTASLDQLLDKAEAAGATFCCPGDDAWPEQLSDLGGLGDQPSERRGGEPFGLWVRGDGVVGDLSRSVAIVGARASTTYGDHVASDLAGECAVKGVLVVSGGAYGIDAAAHRAALACDRPTVAVLAGGIDRYYPAGNTVLLGRVAETGMIVSEAAPGCAPTRSRFLVRNRLIAALTRGTVVVEAALRSGSLNTARWARDLGRGVMGVPGPVTSTASAGVHELLRQPETLLVTEAGEVVEHISPAGEGLAPAKSARAADRDLLEPPSRRLLESVPRVRAASVRSIARLAGLDPTEAADRLQQLASSGWVSNTEDDRWRLPS